MSAISQSGLSEKVYFAVNRKKLYNNTDLFSGRGASPHRRYPRLCWGARERSLRLVRRSADLVWIQSRRY